ncbi:MAG: amidase family protein [Pseudomonadota bacterium]
MTDPCSLSASEVARAVARGDLSAVEIAEAHLARLDRVNPSINAVVQDCRTEARAVASDIDARRQRGEDLGPLAGVPITTKVNADHAGYATTNGLRLLNDNIAEHDSPFIANMRGAGAVTVGRTNTPAFSLRWFTKNGLHGQTLNPRNPAITPGGSSGGAAAAVAAGLCAIAHGTDIAGSIRYPAYACGVHGLRPSLGRVPVLNATSGDRYIGAQLMAVSGPIARTIEDLDLALRVMSVPDRRDPWSIALPPETPDFPKRAAICLAPDGMLVDAPVKQAVADAARHLEDAGWRVDEIPCPPLRPAARINTILWMAETHFAVGDMMEREGDEDAQFVYRIISQDVGAPDLETIMTALKDRAGLMRAWDLFLEEYPLLLCPVSGELPFDQQADVRSEGDFHRIYEAQLTQRGLPVMGMPSLAVATGSAEGRPVGVQLVSARFREDILLAAGAEIEAASPRVTLAEPA